MTPVLLVEASQDIKLRLPLKLSQFGKTVSLAASCRIIDTDTDTHLATLTIGLHEGAIRLYVGPEALEAWSSVEPHPLAGMNDEVRVSEFVAAVDGKEDP